MGTEDLDQKIIRCSLEILADGRPRKGREITKELERYGLSVDKSRVNRLLYYCEAHGILYDHAICCYFLDGARLLGNNDGQGAAEVLTSEGHESLPNDTIPEERKANLTVIGDSSTELEPGMLVRVPTQDELIDHDYDFRDFRLGTFLGCDLVSDTAHISLWEHQIGSTPIEQQVDVPLEVVQRCRIMPETVCFDRSTGHSVVVLQCRDDEFIPGQCAYYFVSSGGSIECLAENRLRPGSHRLDVDPQLQLTSYEFQNPTFRFYRDRLARSHARLRNATTGLEHLVSTRLLLLAHQAEAVTRALSNDTCRFILADEVGLGKTMEACVILKGLRERHGAFRTLVVVPSSLIEQWHNELDRKFWFRFATWHDVLHLGINSVEYGLIVSHEAIESDSSLWKTIQKQDWGLLIVDEAHHVTRSPGLFERLHNLSQRIARVLLLSATPVQQRTNEFLALLRLMYPQRYDLLSEDVFSRMVSSQKALYDVVETVRGSLESRYFEPDEFATYLAPLRPMLLQDEWFTQEIAAIETAGRDATTLERARQLVAYVSEYYRLEYRVIRNRRSSLQDVHFPERVLDESYTYQPAPTERDTLDQLLLYADALVVASADGAAALIQSLFHSAFSSPEALLLLLDLRRNALKKSPIPFRRNLLVPSSPRKETERLENLARTIPEYEGERRLLDNLVRAAETWRESFQMQVQNLDQDYLRRPSEWRLIQVLRAVQKLLSADPAARVVIFTSWQPTYEILRGLLQHHIGHDRLAEFNVSMESDELQREVDRFQSDPRCRVLLSDESGGEGRNFQIASAIVHVDLPWSPAQIEQRIGRIDRLGRQGSVRSVVVYAQGQLEADLFSLFQQSFAVFTSSMSGLEIILEDVQTDIQNAMLRDCADGLRKVTPHVQSFAERMRHEINLERIYEETSIDLGLRSEIESISADYGDGHELRESVCAWAGQIGLTNRNDDDDPDVVTFIPDRFNRNSMRNARITDFPNMEEALSRSGRGRKLVVRGTFNREIAVKREDLVFFAPQGEPWTNVIIQNALESERGRCAAVRLASTAVTEEWRGFELLFSVQVDPRPLYALGFPPIHLFRARGLLSEATDRQIIGIDGKVVGFRSPVSGVIRAAKPGDLKHMGKRSNGSVDAFREEFPQQEWEPLVIERIAQARERVAQMFNLEQEAQALQKRLLAHARATQSARLWLRTLGAPEERDNPREIEAVAEALLEGVSNPLIRLESAAYWHIVPAHA